jgi:hypothetical protein
VQAAGRIRRQGCVTPRCWYSVPLQPAIRSCAIQLQKRRLGVAVATPLRRRRDRWTAIALRRVHRQHTSSDTSTGSIKSLRVLPIAQLAETTEGPIATLSSWDSMNNFCSPTTSPKTIPAIPTTAHVTAPLSTLDYAHVTAATAVEPAKSAVACRCEAQMSSHLQDGEHSAGGFAAVFSLLRSGCGIFDSGRQRLH